MMARNDLGGTGTTNLLHYAQLINENSFQTPRRKDMPPPTDYDKSKLLTNLKDTKILMIIGDKDAFSQRADFVKLTATLRKDNVDILWVPDYNHLDYMWSGDCKDIVNPTLLGFITSK